jgi:LPS export ABC transporter protein LptC
LVLAQLFQQGVPRVSVVPALWHRLLHFPQYFLALVIEIDRAGRERIGKQMQTIAQAIRYRVGAREFEVRAGHAQVIAREKVVMERVHIAFVDAGRGAIEIDAPLAELDLLTDDFVLRGGVEGETAEGERFLTESLQYVREARRLYSDRPVRVIRPNDELAGEGLEIDVETRLLTIRRVRVVVGGA